MGAGTIQQEMRKTAMQELIRFIDNDRMQDSYTKNQILDLLTYKLDKERLDIMQAFFDGRFKGDQWDDVEDYYDKNYKQ